MTDRNFKNSQSPRASRASTQDTLEHSKGEVQYETGSTGRVAPENADAERVKSNLSMESINSRANKPRG